MGKALLFESDGARHFFAVSGKGIVQTAIFRVDVDFWAKLEKNRKIF